MTTDEILEEIGAIGLKVRFAVRDEAIRTVEIPKDALCGDCPVLVWLKTRYPALIAAGRNLDVVSSRAEYKAAARRQFEREIGSGFVAVARASDDPTHPLRGDLMKACGLS